MAGQRATMLLLLALVPAVAGAGAQGSGADPGAIVAVTELPVHPDGFDLRGSRVVAMLPAAGGQDLVMLDLDKREATRLTTVPGADTAVGHVAFDGRYAVWNDDRFGNMDVFVVDVETLASRRVTDHPTPDTQPAVDNGTLVWNRAGALLGASATSPGTFVVQDAVGFSPDPVIHRGIVAWRQTDGDRHAILMKRVDGGNVTVLADGGGRVHVAPTVDHEADHDNTELLAWMAAVPADPRLGKPSTVIIRLADVRTDALDEGGGFPFQWIDLTEDGLVRDPALGGGWVAWTERTGDENAVLRATHLATGTSLLAPGPIAASRVSGDYVVYVQSERGAAPLQAMRLGAVEATDDGGGLAWPLLIVGVVLVAGVLWWARSMTPRHGSK